MAIYYTGRTALDFWRWKAATLSTVERPRPVRRLTLSGGSVDEAQAQIGCAHFRNQEHRVELLVRSKRHTHSSQNARYVVCTRQLPPSAFHRLNEDRFVASPEFAFIALARQLDLIDLVLLGCELTGTYVTSDADERGFVQCEPLATIASLARMASNCTGFGGIKRALAASRHVVENAASPMESCVALLLTMPRRLGGYGLPKPRLNYKLELSREQRIPLKRKSITVDMMWPSAKMAIEYESTAWHHGDEKFVQDSIRRNDIRSLGYDVTTITRNEYKSIAAMDRIAANVAAKVGHRLRFERINRNAQSELRRAMG